jgi:hypothetical protein
MTREIGSEFEFPKTLDCQFGLLLCTGNTTYRHGDDKVGGSFVEPAYLGYDKGCEVGYECLHDKDDGNDGEISQLLGRQLRCELGKNWQLG